MLFFSFFWRLARFFLEKKKKNHYLYSKPNDDRSIDHLLMYLTFSARRRVFRKRSGTSSTGSFGCTTRRHHLSCMLRAVVTGTVAQGLRLRAPGGRGSTLAIANHHEVSAAKNNTDNANPLHQRQRQQHQHQLRRGGARKNHGNNNQSVTASRRLHRCCSIAAAARAEGGDDFTAALAASSSAPASKKGGDTLAEMTTTTTTATKAATTLDGGGGSAMKSEGDWISLGTSAKELRLDNTLPTGQSFRWRKTTEGDYVGVIGQRVVSMRQEEDDVLYRVHCRPTEASVSAGGGGGGGGGFGVEGIVGVEIRAGAGAGAGAGAEGDVSMAMATVMADAAAAARRDAEAVADYFNLDVSLEALSVEWAAADDRFKKLEPFLPGCRMLRQDPAECLFSFICSSNNHISRIHGAYVVHPPRPHTHS